MSPEHPASLLQMIPNCYVLCTLAILKTFVIRSFFFEKWLLTHVFACPKVKNPSASELAADFRLFDTGIKVYATVYHIPSILTSNEISFYYSFWLWVIFLINLCRRIFLPYKQCPCSSITLITWSTYFSQVSRSDASTITRTTGSVPD